MIRFAESALIRVGPGIINLFAIGVLADRLTANAYGLYSTTFATATLLGSIALGPVINGVLPEYSRNATEQRREMFIGLIAGAVVCASIAAAILMVLIPNIAALTLLVVASGSMTALQELLRAQIRLWSYGGVALGQAMTFAVSALFFVYENDLTLALWLYAGSCSIGVSIAFALLGFPRPRFRDLIHLGRTFKVGGLYTASTLVESSFTIGVRYIFLAFGARDALAVYSFCIDISQRLVGVMINLATFQFVPRAYKRGQEAGDAAFIAVLRQGASVGAVASLMSMSLILMGAALELLPDNINNMLDPKIFVLIALGLSVNRLKKLLIDPIAIRFEKSHYILLGYIVAAPVMLLGVALVLLMDWPSLVAVVMLTGYLVAAIVARLSYGHLITHIETRTTRT